MTIHVSANPSPAPEPSTRGRRPHIIVAEDDPDFRDLVHESLERDGYRVSTVATGRELLCSLDEVKRGSEEPPALLLADEQMPGKRGLAVLTQARQWGWTVPMVLVTAFADHALVAQAKHLEVGVVSKPVDMDDLRTLAALWAPAPRASVGAVCEACGQRRDLRPLGSVAPSILCRQCLGGGVRSEMRVTSHPGCWTVPARVGGIGGGEH